LRAWPVLAEDVRLGGEEITMSTRRVVEPLMLPIHAGTLPDTSG
jgi:hypothetical protein